MVEVDMVEVDMVEVPTSFCARLYGRRSAKRRAEMAVVAALARAAASGFPRFKRRHARRSFRVTTGAFGVVDDRHVRLPRIGVIRTREPTTKLAHHLAADTARVLSATVSESAGRWYVSFGIEVEREPPTPAKGRGTTVGVDVGVSHLAVLSTGEVIANPKHLCRSARRMARLRAECSRRAGPTKGRPASKRLAALPGPLGRAHAKVARARSDGLHKLITNLAKNP